MIAGPGRARTTAGALALALAGCAGVEVGAAPAGAHPEGLLVYPPRAVLLPLAIGADGSVVSTRVAWIPDLTRPVRVSTTRGLGRAGVAMTLQDGGTYEGYLVRLETKVDGRVPEVVRAAGDAAAALTGLAILDAAGR